MTLIHLYVRLDDYKTRPLTPTFLASLEKSFARARAGGVKLIPRFTYNFPAAKLDPAVDSDAPLERVLGHLDQLAPVLRNNSDVIAFMEAGFVGAWGEWHDSTNGLDSTAAESMILKKLLQILPPSRMVELRYQRDKIAIFHRQAPLSAAEAFSGSPVARVGHHNDCFLASLDDWGTYRPTNPSALRAQKAYLRSENRYVPQGGETCNAAADAQPFIGCPHALAELEFLHWSQLNSDYEPAVLKLWRAQGCYPLIAARLGYRLRLTKVSLQTIVRAGGILHGEIQLRNDGFASPFNERGFDFVLRDRASGAEYPLRVSADPRRWGPGAHSVHLKLRLPRTIEPQTYDLFLALPDPSLGLAHRPEYSIRLANVGVWEGSTGYNALGMSIRVTGLSR